MAKCYLDLEGSRARNFELDFLRLALAAERDSNCVGIYLAAPLMRNYDRVSEWNRKYDGRMQVAFVPLKLSPEEATRLEQEKRQQQIANRGDATDDIRGRARSTYGEQLCEEKLADIIGKRHVGIAQRKWAEAPVLSEIKWDFFGIIES
jgi:hypothetical protein